MFVIFVTNESAHKFPRPCNSVDLIFHKRTFQLLSRSSTALFYYIYCILLPKLGVINFKLEITLTEMRLAAVIMVN